MTLSELKLVYMFLVDWRSFAVAHEMGSPKMNEAIDIVRREIRLKETDFIRMRDAQGNPIPNEGE